MYQLISHIVNNIKHGCARRFLLLSIYCALCIAGFDAYAQRGFVTKRFDNRQLTFEYTLGELTQQDGIDGITLSSPSTNGYSRTPGQPMLPQYRKIIAIPLGCEITVTVSDTIWESLATGRLRNSAAPRLKSGEPLELPNFDSATTDTTYPVVQTKAIGTMRGTSTALLTISPIRYSPATGQIDICKHLVATVEFKGGESKEYENSLDNDGAQVYLVVSPTKYREKLQPLLSWKRQEGYIVEEHYTDDYNRDGLKAFLQTRYDSATAEHPAPLFILIVGDLDDIPLWNPRHNISGLETHRTDLYYAEYTGDYLPDALIGRISVNDTDQLNTVVAKTLAYERFEMDDSLYMRRSLLVAGKEETEPAPTATNGQVNYLKELLARHDTGHDTICFYNPASDTLIKNILDEMRHGVGLVNYTAHCGPTGWRHPYLSNQTIDSLTTDGSLFLAVNNCCRANDVSGDCFGEHLLRKEGGGAIGAIGACNETLWNEDYWWSTGCSGTPVLHPSYDSSSGGAFNRLLHLYGKPNGGQVWTQSQIVTAGNWAVTASGSPYDAFYWEVYSLIGDPSLMPYIGIPQPITLSYDSIALGDTTVDLYGTPGARVAATWKDTLMSFCVLDSNGAGTLHLTAPVNSNILITATAQWHKPLQRHVIFFPDSTVSVTEAVNESTIRIFPNPTRGKFTISGFSTNTEIGLFDITGHRIATYETKSAIEIGVDLPRGVYFVVFRDKESHVVTGKQKVIVLR